MRNDIGDKVILSLSQAELEEEIANMEMLRDALAASIMANPKIDRKTKDTDVKELRQTFEVAITAMQMVWLNFEGEEYEKR